MGRKGFISEEHERKFQEASQRYNEKQKAARKRREDYKEKLAKVKEEQLDIATKAIQEQTIPDPASLLIEMIKTQQLALADPDLQKNGSLHKSEKTLLLDMFKEYTKLVGGTPPITQAIELTSKEEEEMTGADYLEEFKKFKVVD